MPGFCVSCGAPVTGPFCSQCGAKSLAPVAASQAPLTPTPPVPVAPSYAPVPNVTPATPAVSKKSGWGKILLWVGGIFLLFFLIAAGASIYGYYWVKHKVTSYASAVTNGAGQSMQVAEHGDSCRLLSTADLQQALGVSIEKSVEIVEGSDPGCAYYADKTAFAQLQRKAMEHARKQAQAASNKPGPGGDNPLALLKDTNQLEGIVKTLGLSNTDSDGKVFSFTITRNFGSDSWSGMRLVESAVPGFEEVSGVGDRAMIGAFGHAFYTLKGETMIHMDTTLVPDARTSGAQLARKMFARL
jgi:hypothetical protein